MCNNGALRQGLEICWAFKYIGTKFRDQVIQFGNVYLHLTPIPYEIHKDGYPHVHILFLFSNLTYPYNNTRWLPDNVFKKLKSAWTHGLSDHQSPTSRANHSSLNYILKYVSKSASASHLWQRLLTPDSNYVPETNLNGYPIQKTAYASYKIILIPSSILLDRCIFTKKKIKLLKILVSYLY